MSFQRPHTVVTMMTDDMNVAIAVAIIATEPSIDTSAATIVVEIEVVNGDTAILDGTVAVGAPSANIIVVIVALEVEKIG